MGTAGGTLDWTALRTAMVERQLRQRGIHDERVLGAMEVVPRECFVPRAEIELAYEDMPLPIGHGQTISQPWMVARMLEAAAITSSARVLEVGAGSGYQTALLCELACEVYAVEVIEPLGRQAMARLSALGYRNVQIGMFDGSGGWPEHAPYDVILVAAGAPTVPPRLLEQLGEGGRLIIPVGPRHEQRLAVVCHRNGAFDVAWDAYCSFVDLVGRYGWHAPDADTEPG